MSGLHYEGGHPCRVCGRQTDDYGTCVCITQLSLEEPPSGACCEWCGEPLEVEGFCGVCFEAGRRFL